MNGALEQARGASGQPRVAGEPEPGFGLRSITERVTALGGWVRAGGVLGGGFEVAAVIPMQAQRPTATVTVKNGFAGRELVEAARDADMLVIGSRGQLGFPVPLASEIPNKVAHYTTCPVVIVRPASSAGPVTQEER